MSKEQLMKHLFEISLPYIAFTLEINDKKSLETLKPGQHSQIISAFQSICQSFWPKLCLLNIDYIESFTATDIEYIKGRFLAEIGPLAFLDHQKLKGKHSRIYHLKNDLLKVFMFQLLYLLGYGLKPEFHYYMNIEALPFLLFDDAPKLKEPYYCQFMPALNKNLKYLKPLLFNENALILNFLVDFLNLIYVSSNPGDYGLKIITLGGIEEPKKAIYKLMATKLSDPTKHKSTELFLESQIKNIMKEENIFTRVILPDEGKQFTFDVHKVRNEEHYHIFSSEQKQSSFKPDNPIVLKVNYLQDLTDYVVKPLILKFGIERNMETKEGLTQSIEKLLLRYIQEEKPASEKSVSKKPISEHLFGFEFQPDHISFSSIIKELDEGSIIIQTKALLINDEPTQNGQIKSLPFIVAIRKAFLYTQEITTQYPTLFKSQLEEVDKYARYYEEKWKILMIQISAFNQNQMMKTKLST